MKLTDSRVRTLKPGRYGDDAERGLRLHVGATGRTWHYRYRTEAGLRSVKVGDYPTTSLAEARAQVAKLKQGRKAGIDPTRGTEGPLTFEALARRFIAEYARPQTRTWKEMERILDHDVLPWWKDRPAADIDAEDVKVVLGRVAARGATSQAKAVFIVVRRIFNWAIREAAGTGLSRNPCAAVVPPKHRKRETRHLGDSELRTLVRDLDEAPVLVVIKQAVRFQLWTCARVGEVAGMEWVELDLDARVWNLPAERSKNGRAHKVMLSDQAVALLQGLDRTGPWVFPSPVTGRGMNPNSISGAMLKVTRHLGLQHFGTHALRHTCLTWLAASGCYMEIRNRISNHTDSSIDAVYRHHAYDAEARVWLQRWSNHLEALGAADNVVSLNNGGTA